jgi:hypothetical protein
MRAVPTPLLTLVALVLPALTLLAGLPSHPHILGVLNNAAHVPVFGALAVVIRQILGNESRLEPRTLDVISLLATITIGIAIEFIQPLFFGRNRELEDVWTDALGAAGGLSVLALLRPGRHPMAGAFLSVVLIAGASPIAVAGLGYLERNRQFPALLEVTSPLSLYFIRTDGLGIAQSQLPDAWRRPGDPPSVHCRIRRQPSRVLSHTEPIPDWRPFTRLMIDLTNPESKSLMLTLRIHDRLHNNEYSDRFNRRINLPARTRLTVEIPVIEISAGPRLRQMDVSRIAGIMLFAGDGPELSGRSFYITRIWLEPMPP